MATVTITDTCKQNLEIYQIADYLRVKKWTFTAPATFTKNGVSLNIENLGAQMSLDAIAHFYKCNTCTIFKAIKGV
jgi:hypothetical protein